MEYAVYSHETARVAPELNKAVIEAGLSVDETVPTISNEEECGRASERLAVCRKARKAAEAKFKELQRPFKEGLDAMKVEFEKVVAPIAAKETQWDDAIHAFRQSEREAQQRQQIELDRQRREAERRGVPTEMLPSTYVPPPARGFVHEAGTTAFRKIPKWEIVDESLIPLEMVIDGETVRLWEVVGPSITKVRQRYGEKPSPIPGVRFYYDEGVSVR